MSAADNYLNHIRSRYRLSVPLAEKIRWQEKKIALLRKLAQEDPSRKEWAENEIEGCLLFVRDLRNSDA